MKLSVLYVTLSQCGQCSCAMGATWVWRGRMSYHCYSPHLLKWKTLSDSSRAWGTLHLLTLWLILLALCISRSPGGKCYEASGKYTYLMAISGLISMNLPEWGIMLGLKVCQRAWSVSTSHCISIRTDFHFLTHLQRWAPSTDNSVLLDILLDISVHRVDSRQSLAWLNWVLDRNHARKHKDWADWIRVEQSHQVNHVWPIKYLIRTQQIYVGSVPSI